MAFYNYFLRQIVPFNILARYHYHWSLQTFSMIFIYNYKEGLVYIVALIPRRSSLVYKGLSLIGEVLICTSHAQPIFSCTAEVIQYAISQTQTPTVMASHRQQRSCPTDLVRILWFKVSC